MIHVTINGQIESIPRYYTIAQLIGWLGEADPHLLVEHNRQYVFPEEWPNRTVQSGDQLEFIHPCFGG